MSSRPADEDIRYLRKSNTPVCVATPALAHSGQRPTEISKLMKAGIPICLSVNSTAGCDTADMFAVMRITMIVERMLHANSSVYSTRQVFRHATVEGARALGIDNLTGSLTPGKRADLIIVNTSALNLAPLTVPETLLSSCTYPSNVETVFVGSALPEEDAELVGVRRGFRAQGR